MTDKEQIDLVEEIHLYSRAKEKMGEIDDKMLLWLLRGTILLDVPMFSYQAALVDELEDRLFPEYDGDKVRLEDFGWSTPDGLIIYSEAFCTCDCHRRQNIIHALPCCAKCQHCFRHFTHKAYEQHFGKCSRQPQGDEPPPEELADCDSCGAKVPAWQIRRRFAYGCEGSFCSKCRGVDPEDDR